MVEECIPEKVIVKYKYKGYTGVRGKKKVEQSVLDSGKSMCKLSEVARNMVLKK